MNTKKCEERRKTLITKFNFLTGLILGQTWICESVFQFFYFMNILSKPEIAANGTSIWNHHTWNLKVWSEFLGA